MCEAYVIPFLFGSFFTVCHPYIDVHFLKCFFCYFHCSVDEFFWICFGMVVCVVNSRIGVYMMGIVGRGAY